MCSDMDKVASVNCCYLGVLGLFLLQGVLSVEGRSMFNSGNHVFTTKEEADVHNKILALLVNKRLIPVEQTYPVGLDLASKLAGLEEMQVLRDDLDLERELTANIVVDRKPIPGKRGEPCFWKYCV